MKRKGIKVSEKNVPRISSAEGLTVEKRRDSLYLGEISDAPPNLGNETFMLMTGNLRFQRWWIVSSEDRGSNNESPSQSVACKRLFSAGDRK